MDEMKDQILDTMEDFDVLDDHVMYEGDTYFAMTPFEGEAEGEVFMMKLVEVDGVDMLELVDNEELNNILYEIFKENNKGTYDFED